MRCAAGQLTERRADCAADSAHIWSTRSASMVDLSARPRSVRRASGPRFPSVPAKTGPITGSTLCGSNRGHHRPSRSAWRPRRRAPRSLAGSPRPNRAGPGAIWHVCGPGTAGVLRRQPGRTTLRPGASALFQESPGCPPGSGRPEAGPPGSSGDAPCHCPGPQGTVRRDPGCGKLRGRAECKRHAGPEPASSVQVDACPCQSGYTVSVSHRRAGNAGMPWANADEEVGACRQQ